MLFAKKPKIMIIYPSAECRDEEINCEKVDPTNERMRGCDDVRLLTSIMRITPLPLSLFMED